MALGVYSWSQATDTTNGSTDSTINWQEGQSPPTVNNSARAMMGQIAKWRDDISGAQPSNVVQTCAGTSTAYTLTSNGSIATLTNGWTVTFTVGAALTNTGSVTLAVDSTAASVIQGVTGSNLVGGELVAGSTYTVSYHQPAAAWKLHDFYANAGTTPVAAATFSSGMMIDYAGATAPTGWLLCYGQAISRSTYASLYSLISTTYGAGDGSTTFNIPDCRGRTTFGKDNMGGTAANRVTSGVSIDGTTLGTAGGAQSVTIGQTNIPSYNLVTSALVGNTASVTGVDGINKVTVNLQTSGSNPVLQSGTSLSYGTDWASSASMALTGTLPSGGSGTALASLPPAIILNIIIKT